MPIMLPPGSNITAKEFEIIRRAELIEMREMERYKQDNLYINWCIHEVE